MPSVSSSVEPAVRDRYGEGARQHEQDLCCPVDYDPRYLEVIPEEVLERDYGYDVTMEASGEACGPEGCC